MKLLSNYFFFSLFVLVTVLFSFKFWSFSNIYKYLLYVTVGSYINSYNNLVTKYYHKYNLAKHSTLDPIHSTLDPIHSTLYTQPYTLNPIHSTLYTQPYTLNPIHSTLYTQPSTLYTRPYTLDPRP